MKTNSLESVLLRSINHFCMDYHLHSKNRCCSFAYLISEEPESLAISISQLHRIILAFCKDSLDYSKLGLLVYIFIFHFLFVILRIKFFLISIFVLGFLKSCIDIYDCYRNHFCLLVVYISGWIILKMFQLFEYIIIDMVSLIFIIVV